MGLEQLDSVSSVDIALARQRGDIRNAELINQSQHNSEGLIEWNETRSCGSHEFSIIDSGSIGYFMFVEGSLGDGYTASGRLRLQELGDLLTIEIRGGLDDYCNIENVLPPISISNWLLQQGTKFFTDDFLESADPEPGKPFVDCEECGATDRLINAYFDR